MGLIDFAKDVEVEIATVMRAYGKTDLSKPAAKEWVRGFIKRIIPWWTPGETLSQTEANEVGSRFNALLDWAKRKLAGEDVDPDDE